MISDPRENKERQGELGVSDLVRLLLEDHRRRDEELAAERAQRQEKTRKREEELAAERERRDEQARRREEEVAAERIRREEEVRQHAKCMQEQMDMIRTVVESSRMAVVPSGDSGTASSHPLHLHSMMSPNPLASSTMASSRAGHHGER